MFKHLRLLASAAAVAFCLEPLQASDDFAFMLEEVPGSDFIIGNGEGEGGCMVHNPGYDFNDGILPVAASC